MKKIMKKVSTIFLVLTLLLTLYACGGEGKEQEEQEEPNFTVKIRYDDVDEFDSIYPPTIAKDKYFNEQLLCLDFNVDDNVYAYKYSYYDEKLPDKVYMKYPFVINMKEQSGNVIKLAEGETAKNSKGEDWFTITSVDSVVGKVQFDGYMHIDVGIKVHKGQFPKNKSIIANGKYYHYGTLVESYSADGKEKEGTYSFSINIFDAKSGEMFFAVGETKVEAKEKRELEILSSDVELILTESTEFNDSEREEMLRD